MSGVCGWNDPSLAGLVPSSGALAPTFAAGTTTYTVDVGLSTQTFGLRPSVAMPARATITVDGVTVPSGMTSPARALALGDTVFTVVVTAEGGATRAYVVTVRRAVLVAQQAYLKASNTGAIDEFGHSVAMSGDTLVITTPNEDSAATGVGGDQSSDAAASSGAAYVFVRSGGVWAQQAYLKASNAEAGDEFGRSVAIDGDTIVVGAPSEASAARGVNGDQSSNAARSGAAYVFVRSSGVWTQQAYLKPSNTSIGWGFGGSVAVSANTVAVGAYAEDCSTTGVNGTMCTSGASNSGAVYVFARSGTTWAQQAYIKASNTQADDYFGAAVALSGDTLAVDAYGEDSAATGVNGDQGNNGASASGAVYVFVRSGSVWTQQAYIKASNTGADDYFGGGSLNSGGMALSGDTLVVGASFEDGSGRGVNPDPGSDTATTSGAVYVFTRTGSTWTQQAYLKAADSAQNYTFGYSVAVDGDLVVVGASGANSSMGFAYVFRRAGGVWTQSARVRPSTIDTGDQFGYSVAVSGTTFVAAVPRDDSSSTGVNGDPSNNGTASSGAAYVFSL